MSWIPISPRRGRCYCMVPGENRGSSPKAQQPIAEVHPSMMDRAPDCPHGRSSSGYHQAAGPPPTNSRKHLTCYHWDRYKECKLPESRCLYAHSCEGKIGVACTKVYYIMGLSRTTIPSTSRESSVHNHRRVNTIYQGADDALRLRNVSTLKDNPFLL